MINSKQYNINLKNNFCDIGYRLVDENPKCIGYHHHQGFEILQIWSDSGTVLIDDHIYPIKKSALYLINSSTAHVTNPNPNKDYTRSKITFMPSILMPTLEVTDSLHLFELFTKNESNQFIELKESEAKYFDDCFLKIFNESNKQNSDYNLAIITILIDMLINIYRIRTSTYQSLPKGNINKVVLSVIDYINDHIHQPITIDGICKNLHFSKYYLCHIFKLYTGVTILQFINQQKISRAKNMLTQTNKSISQICMTLGFSGNTQFSRTFKKFTGVSPSYYRKNLIK